MTVEGLLRLSDGTSKATEAWIWREERGTECLGTEMEVAFILQQDQTKARYSE